jgi:AbrB family looped-hinge helix DNA binding protein
MGHTSTISRKGQITIPLEVRKRLGVNYGDKVQFDFDKGQTVLRPAPTDHNPFAEFAGCLSGFTSMEEIVAWERELRDPDREYL